jgi:hypothetical protein
MIIWVWVNTHYGTFWGRWTFIYKPFRCWQGVQGIDPHLLVDNLEWIPNLGSVNSHCRLVTSVSGIIQSFSHWEMLAAMFCGWCFFKFLSRKIPNWILQFTPRFFLQMFTVQVPIFGDITGHRWILSRFWTDSIVMDVLHGVPSFAGNNYTCICIHTHSIRTHTQHIHTYST